MIPISSDQVKKVDDPTPESKAKLHLRYPTGEYLDRFMALQSSGGSMIKYRAAAEKKVTAENHGKSRKDLLPLIAREMARMSDEAGEHDVDGFTRARELVDVFLCGWEGPNWPEFPKDGKPSRMFKLGDLMSLAELISGELDDLTAISVSEAKN